MQNPGQRAKTVLIVEDMEDNRAIYVALLAHYGYRVLEAADGQTGVERARAEVPDLILMDIALPRMDGWTATRHIKADPALHHIPVIAVTAHTRPEDRERAFESGCAAFLIKPIEPRRVLEEVQRFIGPAVDASSPASDAPESPTPG